MNMQDIEDIIEQVHEAGRERLERECAQPEHQKRPTTRVWHYAAALAALMVAGVILLLLPTSSDQPTPDMAHNKLTHSVKQQLDEVRHLATLPQTPISQSEYDYAESSDGVRVYCEDNCNPDEVLARMEMVIKTLQ